MKNIIFQRIHGERKIKQQASNTNKRGEILLFLSWSLKKGINQRSCIFSNKFSLNGENWVNKYEFDLKS